MIINAGLNVDLDSFFEVAELMVKMSNIMGPVVHSKTIIKKANVTSNAENTFIRIIKTTKTE